MFFKKKLQKTACINVYIVSVGYPLGSVKGVNVSI